MPRRFSGLPHVVDLGSIFHFEEAMQYCDENIALKDWDVYITVFYFRKANDAVMFKMRFG
jgi:hypothetical protein